MASLFRNRAPDGSLDLTTTRGQIGVIAFIGLLAFLGVAASVSALVKWKSGGAVSLEPSRGWLEVLEIATNAVLIWNGLGIASMIGKRATSGADRTDVQARQVSGVAATPPAVPGKNIPRNSASVETVSDRPKLTADDDGVL